METRYEIERERGRKSEIQIIYKQVGNTPGVGGNY